MPLNKSGSKQAVSENIKTLIKEGRPQKQAVVIAYSVQEHSGKKHKGMVTSAAKGKKRRNGINA